MVLVSSQRFCVVCLIHIRRTLSHLSLSINTDLRMYTVIFFHLFRFRCVSYSLCASHALRSSSSSDAVKIRVYCRLSIAHRAYAHLRVYRPSFAFSPVVYDGRNVQEFFERLWRDALLLACNTEVDLPQGLS